MCGEQGESSGSYKMFCHSEANANSFLVRSSSTQLVDDDQRVIRHVFRDVGYLFQLNREFLLFGKID